MTTATATPPKLHLGPLSAQERAAIMQHAPSLSAEGRRTFRRLLILAEERGLSTDVIARAASQAREHSL